MQFVTIHGPMELISAHIAERPMHHRTECLKLRRQAWVYKVQKGTGRPGIMDVGKERPPNPMPHVLIQDKQKKVERLFDYSRHPDEAQRRNV